MNTVPLRRLATVVNGGTPTPDSSNWGGEVAWATPVDLGRHDGRTIGATERTLTDRGLVTGSSLLPERSIILSTRAPIGYVCVNTVAMAFNQGCRGLIPRTNVSPDYLRYALLHLRPRLQAAGTGSTFMELSTGSLASMPVPVVGDLVRQDAVVDFLDRETAKIDALIAKQAQLARDVGERVDARWAHEVETLTRDADVVPLRRVVESIVDGPFGSSLTSAHYSHSGARVIRLGNIGLASFRDEDRAYIPDEYARELAAHSVFPGDLVVAGLGDDRWPLGRATVVPDLGVPAIVKADCYRIRPRRSVTASYLAWVLSSPPLREQFQLLSRGSTRSRLNTQLVREALVPVPPPEIQRRVALDHEAATKRHNVLRNSSRLLQTRLSERRAALITAAVTGTLNVTTYGKAG
mgnify:CR=1 FL=1